MRAAAPTHTAHVDIISSLPLLSALLLPQHVWHRFSAADTPAHSSCHILSSHLPHAHSSPSPVLLVSAWFLWVLFSVLFGIMYYARFVAGGTDDRQAGRNKTTLSPFSCAPLSGIPPLRWQTLSSPSLFNILQSAPEHYGDLHCFALVIKAYALDVAALPQSARAFASGTRTRLATSNFSALSHLFAGRTLSCGLFVHCRWFACARRQRADDAHNRTLVAFSSLLTIQHTHVCYTHSSV